MGAGSATTSVLDDRHGELPRGEATRPFAGEAGREERVTEARVETVVAVDRLGEVVAALRRAHPYEEPAIDVVTLLAVP